MKPDILHPFHEADNRVENILIEFDSLYIATNYMILKSLLLTYETSVKEFPLLEEFKLLEDPQLFEISKSYPRNLLFTKLSCNEFPLENSIEFLHNFEQSVVYNVKYMTTIAFGIWRLRESQKVNRIVFYSDFFSDSKLEFLSRTYGDNLINTKIIAYEGNHILEALQEYPDTTTIFMDDLDLLYDTVLCNPDNYTTGIAYFVPRVKYNYLPMDIKADPVLKYLFEIDDFETKEKGQVNFFNIEL